MEIGDELYNVTFEEGTVYSIYTDSTGVLSFPTNTYSGAEEFSIALRDQVFDGGLCTADNLTHCATADQDPTFTYGIGHLSVGRIFTPYKIDSQGDALISIYVNGRDGYCCGPMDGIGYGALQYPKINSSSTEVSYVWAKWDKVSVVPLPATAWLLLTSIGGLFGVNKWNKRKLTA